MNSKFFKYIVFLFFYFILFQTLVCAQKSTTNLFPRTTLDFYILESELSEGNYLVGDIYDLGYRIYDYKEIPNNRPINDRMITLRSDVYIDSVYTDQKLYLVTMPVNSPCNIYFNGELIFVQGNYKNGYTSRMHFSENIFLAPDMIRFNENNQIAFQLYPEEGEKHPLNKPFISNARDATNYVFYRNLLGPKLIFASSFCGFIFFIFFLFTYISRREYGKPEYLYFAFMNLFLIFSFINNIFSYDYTNTFIVELISRLGFQLSMIVGLLFLIEYTNVFKNKLFLKIGIAIIYVPAIILLSMQDNLAELIRVNNSYPMYILIFGNIFFVVITSIYFIKERNIKSFTLLFIYLVNLFSGFFDSYYFVILKVKPYVMMTPNSVFLINLTIFFILLIDHSKIYHLAVNSSKQLRELNENLESLVEKRTEKTIEYANKLEEVNKTILFNYCS